MRRSSWNQFKNCMFGLLGVSLLIWAADAVAQDKDTDFKATAEFNKNAELQNNGLYTSAAASWKKWIASFSKGKRVDEAHFYLGICQLHLKQFTEAATSFRTVLSKFASSKLRDRAQYNLGMALFQTAVASKDAKQFTAGAAELAKVAASYPQSPYVPKALYYQGEALFAAGDRPAAIAAYKKLIASHGKSSLAGDAHYALGTVQQELEQFEDAAATYGSFVKNPLFAKHRMANEIRLRLAMCLQQLKKYAEADTHFTVVAAVPNFPFADFAMLSQAECRLENNKAADAVTTLNALLQKFAQSSYRIRAQLLLGKSYVELKKPTEAQAPLQAVLNAKTPESAEAAYLLGQALLSLNKPADALAILQPASTTFAKSEFGPHLAMARIEATYALPDRRKETIALYDDFAKTHPDHELAPWAVYKAAVTALELDDFAAVRKSGESFLGNQKFASHQLVPSVLYVTAEGHLLGSDSGDKTADLNRARAHYEKLIGQFPNHENASHSYVRIGWCQLQAKQYDPAAQFLASSLAKMKDPMHVAEAQLLIGRCHSQKDRHKEAVVAYDAALKAKPDWQRRDEALLAAAQSLRALEAYGPATDRLKQLTAITTSTLRDRATFVLGEIAHGEKQYDAAIAHYKAVVDNFADSPLAANAAFRQGASNFAKQDYQGAIAPLTLLLGKYAESKASADGKYLRGLCYERLKQHENAIKDLAAYLAGKPEGDQALDARYYLAVCKVGLKQFAPAVVDLALLVKDNPNYTNADKAYYEMGYALKELKRDKEAATAFRTLAEKLPNSVHAAEGWFQVGRFHEEASKQANIPEDQKKTELANATKAFTAGLEKAKKPALREKVFYKLGVLQYRQQQYAQAVATLLAQTKELPEGELAG
ncbi:MAG: tetratricopeptide repeat protein, partial [Planctomycetes bacterium]|nr:tetratricopeptide repeat protein [Planctomycetota bacterium]